MKGLLLKDFYMAMKYCRTYVIIAVAFSLLSVWGDTSFLLAYPVLLASVIPVNLIAYDEKSKWSSYSGVFPYSRQQLVSVKYLMALISLAFAIIFVLMGQIARMLINNAFDVSVVLSLVALLPAMGILAPSLMLPAIFKFGAEKGRIVFYTIICAVCAAFGILGAIGEEADLTNLMISMQSWLIPVITSVSVVVLAASWLLSIRLYKKKEI